DLHGLARPGHHDGPLTVRNVHATPASWHSACHFCSAAGRRDGRWSVGQPCTGRYFLSTCRASTDLCSSSGPSPIDPNLVIRYQDSTGRSPEYPNAPHTWMVRSRTASTTFDTWALIMPSSARTSPAPKRSIFQAVWKVSSLAA